MDLWRIEGDLPNQVAVSRFHCIRLFWEHCWIYQGLWFLIITINAKLWGLNGVQSWSQMFGECKAHWASVDITAPDYCLTFSFIVNKRLYWGIRNFSKCTTRPVWLMSELCCCMWWKVKNGDLLIIREGFLFSYGGGRLCAPTPHTNIIGFHIEEGKSPPKLRYPSPIATTILVYLCMYSAPEKQASSLYILHRAGNW